jgi:CHAT domain-containing protein
VIVRHAAVALALFSLQPAVAIAAPQRPSAQDSFRLGQGKGVLCIAQASDGDKALTSIFDRAYAIVCRDAAVPVGRLYAFAGNPAEPLRRLESQRAEQASCTAGEPVRLDDVGMATTLECKMTAGDIGYRVYSWRAGKRSFVAEGFAGYDPALRLGLRTLVADRFVPGEIEVATTAAGDPAAFARTQAGNLNIGQALAEGYRRNNSGDYAEASEFFDTLLQRAATMPGASSDQSEYLVNRALQQSNLGNFSESEALFGQANAIVTADPVQLRLRRNFRAIDLINQQRLPEALAEIDRVFNPVDAAVASVAGDKGMIDPHTAARLNAAASLSQGLSSADAASLTPEERAGVLDAQAGQLRGTILRLQGKIPEAEAALTKALAAMDAIRGGQVASTTRLRAQALVDLALLAEARSAYPDAERQLRQSAMLLETEYPGSSAARAAQARLAAYLARRGQVEPALAIYREVVGSMTAGSSSPALRRMLAPYFALLTRQIATRPELVTDLFLASETLIRPGVSDTQSVLARELSGGSDEASRLFRQSVTLIRDIERNRVELARLSGASDPTTNETTRIVELKRLLRNLEADQTSTQSRLSQFPRYRALSTQALTLADLQKALRPGEGYFRLAIVGQDIYGIFVDPTAATAWRADITADQLSRDVDTLRDTIAKENDGRILTYPFNVALARKLFVALLQPVQPRLGALKHLIVEPDGALLRLPPTLLVTEQSGVDAYLARVKKGGDDFDFTGVAWLGRDIDISTSVSARAFRDVRAVAPSAAPKAYLGLGHNARASLLTPASLPVNALPAGAGVDCSWPLDVWNNPISATELHLAQSILSAGGADVVTDQAFTDTALVARGDLSQYRVLHFATHGLVTAPRPDCPARPALLTSFGGEGSDGLLSFKEIYDLHLDADMVILSACDTAGKATVAATREAGVTTGGDYALDGLVRAFIGAGGRSVIASHWPVPDDYNATQRLIGGLFKATAGTPIANSLRTAQRDLMDHAETSHPYYWAGFAIIGDGSRAMLRTAADIAANRPAAGGAAGGH